MVSQLSLTGFVCKNLLCRRLATLLTLCGIGISIGAFVRLVGFSNAFEHAWLRLHATGGTDIADTQQTFLNTSMDESSRQKLMALPEVEQVPPMIYNAMDLTPEVNALVYGWKAASYEFQSPQLLLGKPFLDGHPEVMLGDLLSENLSKKPSDTLEIQGSLFTLKAVYHGGSAFETASFIMQLDQLQQLSRLQGIVSTTLGRWRPASAGEAPDQYLKRAQAQIEATLRLSRAVPAAERASNNQFVRLAHDSAWDTSWIAALIGILGIASSMAKPVFECTRKVGVLRALGWKRKQVLVLIQLEAVFLASSVMRFRRGEARLSWVEALRHE
jgi:putative ABC transport system permease protein